LLFSPSSSSIVLPLQQCLVSSFLSKEGKFSFECSSQSHGTTSVIYHDPTLGFGLLSHPCSQLLFFAPSSFTECSAPCPTPNL
jgi:hypothetical protein